MKFSELQNIPAIFADLVDSTLSSQQFITKIPNLGDLRSRAQQVSIPSTFRQQICRLLTIQNGNFHGGEAVLKSIERLKEPSTNVVLFDLPAYLFGGPLSLLLKCITAVKLVADLAGVGVSAVAVAWIRPCDRHNGKCGSITVLDEEASLKEIKLAAAGQLSESANEDILLPEEISVQLQRLEHVLGRHAHPDVLDLLEQSYRPGSSLSLACGKFFSRLLGESGIVMIDPLDHKVQEMARPFYLQVADRAGNIAGLLRERLLALRQSGYLTADPSALADPDSLELRLKALSASCLNGRIPPPGSATLSMLMIPIFLGSILPISTILVDPWQLDEFALISGLYSEFGRSVPPIFPSLSATLLDARSRNFLGKYGFSFRDLFEGKNKLLQSFRAENPAVAAGVELDGLIQESDQSLFPLLKESIGDRKLRGAIEDSQHKVHFQLAKLRERLMAAGEERLAAANRQISRICNTVAPDGGLQERQIGMVFFLCRHSWSLPRILETKLDLWTLEHQLIPVD